MQRAGTTRWHSLITDHPDAVEVHDPYGRVIKEIHWFDTPLDDDASARDALRESVWRGMYGAQIDYLLGVFPREQVYVALFEDCVRRPLEELTRMYEFLDLDPSFRPPTLYATVNSPPVERQASEFFIPREPSTRRIGSAWSSFCQM